MRTLFFLVFAANVLLILVSLAVLPDKVAIHFGSGGVPDSWASKEWNAILFLLVQAFFFPLLWFAPSLALRLPTRWINLPNKGYWLRAENRPALKRKLETLTARFGTAFFLFFFCAGLLTVQANLSQPVRLNERALLLLVLLFLLYTIFWSIGLIRSFRAPGSGGARTGGPG